MQSPFSRALAFAFSLFLLTNLALRLAAPRFDSTLWIIDLHALPRIGAYALLLGAGLLLGAYAIVPETRSRRRAATLLTVGALAAVAIANAVQVQMLSTRGFITGTAPLSISLLVAVLLGSILVSIARGPRKVSRAGAAGWVALAMVGIVAFPLAQIFVYGKTDYRRQADAVVVFGARVYADGRPSDALADRMRTAGELILQGYAPILIVSGGPGDGEIHETQTMRRLAMEMGIPAESILVDERGLNTRATVNTLSVLVHQQRYQKILAVSHFYHLPRIKLTAQRAGVDLYTIPARESYTLSRLPWFIAREVIACWAYYLNPAVIRPGDP